MIEKMFYKQRTDFEISSAKRNQELEFPKDVVEAKDIRYCEDDCEAHRMDMFRPAGREQEVLPVIVNIHGGGLLIGNKEFNRFYCARLSELGFLVYSLEYRLVPDCTFFDQLTDVSLAMDCIKERIADDQGDISHVYACADSGGGCLLTYFAAMQKNPALAEAAHVTPSNLPLRALGLISGMFYTTRFDQIGLFLPKYLYGKHYKKEAFAPYANPENPGVVASLPPCYLVTSKNDNLQRYTLDFVKVLAKNKIPYRLQNFPKKAELTHAFSVFYPFLEESSQSIEAMVEFFRKYAEK